MGAAPRKHAVALGFTVQQRVLMLNCSHRTNSQCAIHQRRWMVRQSSTADQTRISQLHERFPGDLNRRRRVNVVELDDVNAIDTETLEAALDVGPHREAASVLPVTVVHRADRAALRVDGHTPLRVLKRLGDDLLSSTPAVERRRVNEGDTGVDGRQHRVDSRRSVLHAPPQGPVRTRSKRRSTQTPSSR